MLFSLYYAVVNALYVLCIVFIVLSLSLSAHIVLFALVNLIGNENIIFPAWLFSLNLCRHFLCWNIVAIILLICM